MSLLAYYGLVVSISLSGVMAPGPITAVTLVRGRRDPLAGLWINTGHAIAEIPLILALLMGLQPFLQSKSVYALISFVGGIVMLWMGMGLIRHRTDRTHNRDTASEQRGPIREGAAITALNPYWFLWWLTIGSGLLARGRMFNDYTVLFGMVILHLACDFIWGTFLSFAINRGERILLPRIWRFIETICGGALLLFGGAFLYEGAWKGLF